MDEKVDINIVKTFAAAAIRAVKSQCSTQIDVGMPRYRKDGAGFPTDIDVASFLDIKSDKFNGTMALCYPRSTFLGMMHSMTKETHTIINASVRDGSAELLNIIFGEVKQVLNQNGYTLPMAIPQVLLADAAIERLLALDPAVIVPFETQHGPFFAQIGLPRITSTKITERYSNAVTDSNSFPSNTRILIVDDMNTMRKVVHRTLNNIGYQSIVEADDGQTAWNLIGQTCQQGKPFQLIISDWNMPIMKGIDLLRKVRANPQTRTTPFILLTAESEINQVMEGMQLGASAYILKPFTADVFTAKIKEVWQKIQKNQADQKAS